jgi:hypothetical protein
MASRSSRVAGQRSRTGWCGDKEADEHEPDDGAGWRRIKSRGLARSVVIIRNRRLAWLRTSAPFTRLALTPVSVNGRRPA